MEEVLGLLGFSFGASLGVGAVRSLGEGGRPLLRDALKVGLRAWDTFAAAGAAAKREAGEAVSEAGAESQARARGRGRVKAQKIVIAHD